MVNTNTMTCFEVTDPVREMTTKRIGEQLYPDLEFVKTDHIGEFLDKENPAKNIIVGCSDYSVTKPQVEKFKQNGGIHMFAKNLDCDEDECVKRFPIGLEDQFRWYDFDKFDIIRSCREAFCGEIDDKTIYLNFSLWTNKRKRAECLDEFKGKQNATIDPHMLKGNTVSHFSPEATMNFYNNVLRHRFAASPTGNGIDCQRTYEILLLGRIPVCTRNHVVTSEFTKRLPVLVLDSWNEIEVKSRQFLENYDESNYDFSVLSEGWWLNHIKETIVK